MRMYDVIHMLYIQQLDSEVLPSTDAHLCVLATENILSKSDEYLLSLTLVHSLTSNEISNPLILLSS